MPAHEHVPFEHLVRRKLYKEKNGRWYCRVFDTRTKRLHKVCTRQTVKRLADKAVDDWIKAKLREDSDGISHFRRFDEAYEEYLRTRQISASTRIEYKSCYRQFLPHFGEKYVHEITFADVEHFLKESELKRRSRRTRQKHLAYLRAFFRWAIHRQLARKNPTDGQSVPNATRRVGVALTREEAERLVRACERRFKKDLQNGRGKWEQEYVPPRYLLLAVLISLHTGLRRGNVLGLKWKHVDLDRRSIRLPAAMLKTDVDHEIPLHDELYHLFYGREGDPDDPVVGKKLKSITKSFKAAVKRAGVRDLRWHDLRHTFSTWIAGVTSLAVQQRLLSHSPGKNMSLRYTHVPFEKLKKAIDALPNLHRENYTFLPGSRTYTGDATFSDPVEAEPGEMYREDYEEVHYGIRDHDPNG